MLPDRHGSNEKYRYGFNSKEKDDEIKGEGNIYDFGARLLDPRIGRWFAPDPEEKQGPEYSTYNYAFNNPSNFIDPDGQWPDLPSWNSIKNEYAKLKKTTAKYIEYQKNKIKRDLKDIAKKLDNGWTAKHVKAKVTIGFQAGIKTPFGSVEGGLVTVDVAKYSDGNLKGPNEMDGKGHYFFGMKATTGSGKNKKETGGKVDWVNDTALPNGNGNGSNGNTDLLNRSSYKGKFEYEGGWGPKFSSKRKFGEISTPSHKIAQKFSNKEECNNCQEYQFGAKAIIGFEIKITFP